MGELQFPRTIRISEAAHAEVAEAAEARGMKLSDLASRLILAGIARLPEPQTID